MVTGLAEKGPAVRQRRLAGSGIEHAHELLVARDGAHRKATADDLSQRRQIRIDIPQTLAHRDSPGERDDLIEDQQRPDLAGDLAQRFEIGLVGRRKAGAVRHRTTSTQGKLGGRARGIRLTAQLPHR